MQRDLSRQWVILKDFRYIVIFMDTHGNIIRLCMAIMIKDFPLLQGNFPIL